MPKKTHTHRTHTLVLVPPLIRCFLFSYSFTFAITTTTHAWWTTVKVCSTLMSIHTANKVLKAGHKHICSLSASRFHLARTNMSSLAHSLSYSHTQMHTGDLCGATDACELGVNATNPILKKYTIQSRVKNKYHTLHLTLLPSLSPHRTCIISLFVRLQTTTWKHVLSTP